jgi:EAL domain-containing protein (putative c-di-GMP-specific phosphodiesterase class I)
MTNAIDATATPAPADRLASTYAHRITAALPLMAAQRVSMHDSRGNVQWQSNNVWGPAERDAVRLALERFVGQTAPTRADHPLPDQRTAVLLRAADTGNVFRGFVMLIVDNRRLRGKGQSIRDLPVPVQRAVHEWASKLALEAAPVHATESSPADGVPPTLSAAETSELLEREPTVNDADVDEHFSRLREFPVALAAQPLLPLQSGMRIKRFEILLRDASETHNAAPVSLLRDADERGLGSVLDRRVAGAMFVWLAERNDVFAEELAQFSVNLSATSLADPNFLRFISLCIAKSGILPQLLAFEVDQSQWRSDRARVQRLARALDGMGVGLVIDNCTLHEDIIELLSLPGVCLVKIDRQLTRDLSASRMAQMRIAGLAQMARVAGIHTVAKQVDLPEEQEQLRVLGVDFVQGFGNAMPMPLETLDREREQRTVVDESVAPAAAEPAPEDQPLPQVACG